MERTRDGQHVITDQQLIDLLIRCWIRCSNESRSCSSSCRDLQLLLSPSPLSPAHIRRGFSQ